MAFGPGKYDDACTNVRTVTGGSVLLIVIDRALGSGFACQADLATTLQLPALLESVAAQIRRDGIGTEGPQRSS